MAQSAATMRFGILGPWGGNLGDAAIQEAMLHAIRAAHTEPQIVGFSLIPSDTEQRHGIPSFPTGRWESQGADGWLARIAARLQSSSRPALRNLARWLVRGPLEFGLIVEAYRNLTGLDYLIISGGGQLDDYWGGPWSHPYTLLKFALLARLRGARVLFVSVGAGPLDSRLSTWFVKAALSLAHYLSYRDEDSKRFMARKGFRRDAPVYPDLAHSLNIEPYLRQPAPASARPIVGVGPMSYFDPRIWPERDQQVYLRYLSKLADLTAWVIEQGYDVLFYPGEAGFDVDVIADLLELLAARGIAPDDPRLIVPPIATVDALMTQLARTEMVIASRFHGVLLPQLLNKPALALSYHPKIDHLMADMGQAEYCLPIDRFDVATAKERFTEMAANRAAIKATMAARTQAYREALDKQYRALFR